MEAKAAALAHKRAVLMAQLATERATLALQSAALRPAARKVDKVISGIRYVKSHPEALMLPLVMLALWRPKRLITFALSGLSFWRLVQQGRRGLRR